MIWALVLQRRSPGDFGPSIERGSFALLQLPNPNDHIQILNERGQCDLLRVDYVQHTPASRISDPMVRLVGPKRGLGLHNSVS